MVVEIRSRPEFLEEVGLGYLTLDRAAPTLSGGEAQRIRLAAQLGSNLQGVCYVLTSPPSACTRATTASCSNALAKLGDKGNTLVVVEHDEDTIRRADHIIDIGPGAGKRGGRLVAQGTVAGPGSRATPTRSPAASSAAAAHPLQPARAVADRHRRCSCRAPNLQQPAHVDVQVPLQRLVAVTGVRLGQEHAGARRAAGQRAGRRGEGQRAGRARAAPALRPAWTAAPGWTGFEGPRARGRPDAHRQDAALLPGHLHRLLGRHPQAVHRDAGGEGARLRPARFASTPATAAARPAKARACAPSR